MKFNRVRTTEWPANRFRTLCCRRVDYASRFAYAVHNRRPRRPRQRHVAIASITSRQQDTPPTRRPYLTVRLVRLLITVTYQPGNLRTHTAYPTAKYDRNWAYVYNNIMIVLVCCVCLFTIFFIFFLNPTTQ